MSAVREIPATHQLAGVPPLSVENALDRSEWFLRYALDHPDGISRHSAFRSHGQAALTQHAAVRKALDLEAAA